MASLLALVMELNHQNRPDKHTKRIEWNNSWENDLARLYKNIEDRDIITGTESPPALKRHIASVSGELKLEIEKRAQTIGKLQRQTRDFALPKLASGELEKQWQGLSNNRRKEMILEVLYTASCIQGSSMETLRKWCPDMTVPHLSANQGQLFLDYLKLVVAKFEEEMLQPVHFPNVSADKMLSGFDIEIMRREHLSLRTNFVTFMIFRLLTSLYGVNQTILPSKPVKEPFDKATRETSTKLGGKEFARYFEQREKEYRKGLKEGMGSVCWSCGKGASKLPSGTQLKVCMKCKEIGRIISYCSRECQKEDWKNGTPQPHKLICGKLLENKSKQQETPKVREGSLMKIPEPAPTFKRSFALLQQISFLNRASNSDYVVMSKVLGRNHKSSLTGIGHRSCRQEIVLALEFASQCKSTDAFAELRLGFLVVRRRAMYNGDKDAVNAMFTFLLPFVKNKDLPPDSLVDQLEREYGVKVDLTSGNNTLAPPMPDEMEWAHDLLASFEGK